MQIPDFLQQHQQQYQQWRRHIHRNPEMAFEEVATAEFVAEKLRSFGLKVTTGIATTGVVGTLTRGESNRAVGLRADLDALPITELNEFAHKSTQPGVMHACGHDGHTVMLLAAAHYLSEQASFNGTVHFIFQPAEENEGGGKAMIDDGLFERFPVEAVYGMHNIPGIAVGEFAIKPGPMMAAFDIFDVKITGKGSHAAMPQQGVDPIVIASQIVNAYQTIVSRNVDAMDAAVVSVTQVHSGDAYNVIPETATIAGCTRSFSVRVQALLEQRLEQIAQQICAAHGASCEFVYDRRYPPTVNSEAETRIAVSAAQAVVGEHKVATNPRAAMGSEDFAYMLQAKPGSYIWVGNGKGEGSCMIHNAHYDFNDQIIPIGASYWAELAHQALASG